jgi:hypothetical protein
MGGVSIMDAPAASDFDPDQVGQQIALFVRTAFATEHVLAMACCGGLTDQQFDGRIL